MFEGFWLRAPHAVEKTFFWTIEDVVCVLLAGQGKQVEGNKDQVGI